MTAEVPLSVRVERVKTKDTPESIKKTTVDELDSDDLSPGNVLSKFENLNQLQTLVNRMVFIFGRFNSNPNQTEAFSIVGETLTSIQESMKERQIGRNKFNGQIQNFNVIILHSGLTPTLFLEKQTQLEQKDLLMFLLDAERYSTSISNRGRMQNVLGLQLTGRSVPIFLSTDQTIYTAKEVEIISRPVYIPEFEKVLDQLRNDAQNETSQNYLAKLGSLVANHLPQAHKHQ